MMDKALRGRDDLYTPTPEHYEYTVAARIRSAQTGMISSLETRLS